MNTRRCFGLVLLACLAGAPEADAQGPVTVTFSPSKDNTIYEFPVGGLPLSNGAGANWFIGKTTQNLTRRGLMAFNLASIPAEATILDVTLTVHLSRSAIAGLEDMTMHRVLANWGEGTSNAANNEGRGANATTNDATWQLRFHPNLSMSWPFGGSFVSTPSLTKPIGNIDFYSLSSTGLIADVQQWVTTPATNFGWIFRGNEFASGTAKRFDTKENSDASVRPVLSVVYTLGPVCDSIDFNNDNSFFDPQDVEALLSVYSEGPCVPSGATCNDIDFNNDGSLFDPQDIDAFLSVYSEGPCL